MSQGAWITTRNERSLDRAFLGFVLFFFYHIFSEVSFSPAQTRLFLFLFNRSAGPPHFLLAFILDVMGQLEQFAFLLNSLSCECRY